MKLPFQVILIAAAAASTFTFADALEEASDAAGATEAEAEAATQTPAWLNQREVRQLREGRGMGMGRVAVVNGYPGPMHVLRQAEALELSDEQREQTTGLRERVHAQSRQIGNRILAAETRLGEALAAADVDREALRKILDEIADLRADLRATHIEAHLDQAAILTPQQRSRMSELGAQMRPGHGEGRRQGRHQRQRERQGGRRDIED
jgi:Spy/CpxP family protein refolding chaperone